MNRVLIGLLVFLTAGVVAAIAQTPPRDDGHVRSPYVTSTGETVDRPGVPQASGTTSLDRKIQRQDNTIDKGICKGC